MQLARTRGEDERISGWMQIAGAVVLPSVGQANIALATTSVGKDMQPKPQCNVAKGPSQPGNSYPTSSIQA